MLHPDAVDILLVEDNPNDAELTQRALSKKNLANRLYIVEDGIQAMDFLNCKGDFSERSGAHQPKVILLDLKLPKMNGLEVLAEIKKDPKLSTIPVVMVTSSREDPDIQEAYRLGANSYVVKPVDFDEFLSTMSELGFYWLMLNQPRNS